MQERDQRNQPRVFDHVDESSLVFDGWCTEMSIRIFQTRHEVMLYPGGKMIISFNYLRVHVRYSPQPTDQEASSVADLTCLGIPISRGISTKTETIISCPRSHFVS